MRLPRRDPGGISGGRQLSVRYGKPAFVMLRSGFFPWWVFSMRVIDHLARAEQPFISFEIIPPLRGGSLPRLLSLIDDLVAFDPPFIDITSHSAQVHYEETAQGLQTKVKRKRPGTLTKNQHSAVRAMLWFLKPGYTHREYQY